MTDQPASAERLSEVARLATLLADRVLDAQIMSRPILDAQVRALLDAALVLEEHAMPLPPLLMQILNEVGKTSDQTVAADASLQMAQASPDGAAGSSRAGPVQGFSCPLRSLGEQ